MQKLDLIQKSEMINAKIALIKPLHLSNILKVTRIFINLTQRPKLKRFTHLSKNSENFNDLTLFSKCSIVGTA